jgi:hypothetical protein
MRSARICVAHQFWGIRLGTSAAASVFAQSTLRGLLQRYPQGQVFIFNKDGGLLDMGDDRDMRCCNEGDESTKRKFEKKKELLRAYQLLDICPEARGIIFFHLWDFQKD